MKRQVPKPYLQLSDRSILEHTLRRFLSLKGLRQVIVATSEDFLDEAQQILNDNVPQNIVSAVIAGGRERQHSVYNALNGLLDVDLVIIHDAVRPFVQLNHINACCEAASESGGAVLGVPVKDTIKRINNEQLIQETPDRKFLWQTQTPQVFTKQLIVEAYERALKENYVSTDDASLVERLDQKVKMIEGDQSNFKITYPLDLKLARLLIEKEQE